MENRNY